MKSLVRPLQLGKVRLSSNVLYSPLAGCSDFPYRKMSAKYLPALIFPEMVKMDALVRNDEGTFHILDYDVGMHPIGAQMVGSKPEIAGKAAWMLQEMGFDVVDLNCGCPVDKVTKDGSGSGMLKNPNRIGDVIANMVAAVNVPVTVKIRTGWDEEHINAVTITEIAELAGAKAITIHGRTRAQGYKGPANWGHIKACKEVAKEIKIIGNGDVFTAQAALLLLEQTGCDGVMASRGTMGQPWIADDIYRLAAGEEVRVRTIEEKREALLEHFEYTLAYHHARRVVTDMRRVGCWYFTKSPRTREFRGAISKASSVEEVRHLIQHFQFGEPQEAQELLDEEPAVELCTT